jgi:hypothetical protein
MAMSVAVVAALLLQAPPPAHPSAAGTYEVRLCSSACDGQPPGELLAIGVLVLDTVPLVPSRYFSDSPNACFDFRLGRRLHSWAAFYPASQTYWYQSPGTNTISFDTFRSPDVGHRVSAVLTDSGFVGVGRSWGQGVSEARMPDEYVIGRRLGPPDPRRCSDVRSQRRWAWFTPPVFLALAIATIVLATRIDR